MKTNKKGQMNSLIVVATGIIIFALIIATGLVILQGFGDSVVVCSSGFENVSVSNETGWVNGTGYTLSGASAYGFKTPILTQVLNMTTNQTIGLTNATVSNSGIVTNATSYNWNSIYISYTYVWDNTHTWSSSTQTCLNATGGDAETGAGTAYTTTALNSSYLQNNLVTWIPAIIALLIGLIFIGLLMGKKKTKY